MGPSHWPTEFVTGPVLPKALRRIPIVSSALPCCCVVSSLSPLWVNFLSCNFSFFFRFLLCFYNVCVLLGLVYSTMMLRLLVIVGGWFNGGTMQADFACVTASCPLFREGGGGSVAILLLPSTEQPVRRLGARRRHVDQLELDQQREVVGGYVRMRTSDHLVLP